MGKTAVVFKDIGKACNDLLSKDYKVGKSSVEVKSKTSSGVTLTPTATKTGDKVSGSLAAKYALMPWLTSEATLNTCGALDLTIEACDALSQGLTLTAECSATGKGNCLLSKGTLIADYKTEVGTCKASYDYYSDTLTAAASFVYGAFVGGVDCSYNTGKGALSKYSTACQLTQPDFVVSAKCASNKGALTLGCGYYHTVSPDLQIGVDLCKPLEKADLGIEFGCAYKLDKETSVKGKVDADGKLSASYKQKLSKLTTMTLAAQIDTVNLNEAKHKFGLQLNMTP